MNSFFKAFRDHAIIPILLVAAFVILNRLAYSGPALLDTRVTNIAIKIEQAFQDNTSQAEKRKTILDGLLEQDRTDFWKSLAERLAEACLLSAVMIVAVEGPARRRAADQDAKAKIQMAHEETKIVSEISSEFRAQVNEVSTNVWNAIFRKLVPDPIAVEIQKILKSDVCRIRPTYVITLTDGGYAGLRSDEIVVKRALSYRLTNLTGDELPYPLRISVKSHTPDREVIKGGDVHILPRICKVSVNGKAYELDHKSRMTFEETLHLPKMTTEDQAWLVISEVEEILKVNDRSLYVLREPCAGIDVQVFNEIRKRVRLLKEQVYLSSGTERLVEDVQERWTYNGGLLSGTALSIAWEAVPDDEV